MNHQLLMKKYFTIWSSRLIYDASTVCNTVFLETLKYEFWRIPKNSTLSTLSKLCLDMVELSTCIATYVGLHRNNIGFNECA